MPITIAFAHATGFCGGVWRPVVNEAKSRFNTLTWDFPNHGSGPAIPSPVDWWAFGEWARDQVAGLSGPVIGVGHSMGGAALVMAEILAPKTFAAFVLIEPMLLPPPYQRAENNLSRGVRKRRRVFESRLAARENFASKAPFLNWHPDALDAYVDCGLVETDEGVELTCRPEQEADIYEGSTAHGAFDRVSEVDVPTLILAGSETDVYPEAHLRAMIERFPSAGLEILAGENHFLPMERPDLVARRIERMANGLAA